jgi:hypothetical protein
MFLDHVHAESLDEGRLADTGGAGDSDPAGTSGQGKECLEDSIGEYAMIGTCRFGQRYRPGERSPITIADALDEGIRIVGLTGHATGRWAEMSPRTLRAAAGMLVPGPKMAATPAS